MSQRTLDQQPSVKPYNLQAHDLQIGMDICIKIIKNNKDFFDQSLDEIKLLKYVNKHDPADKFNLLRLYDYFYYRERLLIVCELLKANLYEFRKFKIAATVDVKSKSSTLEVAVSRQITYARNVLFQNDSPASLLARVIGIIRTIDHEMLTKGRDSHKHPWVSYPYEPIST
ncbi:probable serine/threonine-protein kinase dyrk2 [Brassica napus]|uniref:probable serine/threonine-protein kinase dyrk2 n=1 Tax=Brassica napus TaxID=3708 RepID=UPI0006AB6EE4|nr:probable serine/threonine-protein kinase dyrk2 [Brassica napus]